jgi:hypothetical protein
MDKCALCHATNERMFKCGQCRSVVYCSVACQTQDWSRHKKHNCVPRIPKQTCACFGPDEHTLAYRSATRQCGVPVCNNVLPDAGRNVPVSVYCKPCEVQQGAVVHRIVLGYCSDECAANRMGHAVDLPPAK